MFVAAAIPLVDPDLQLLPLHFAYDPGPGVDWSATPAAAPHSGDDAAGFNLTLLGRYLDLAWLPEGGAGGGAMERGRSGSGGGGGGGGVVHQVQTVARQFGSLGRSMSRKLKGLGRGRREGGGAGRAGVGGGATAVPCARLVHRRPEYQQRMVDNYLAAARARFEEQQGGGAREGARDGVAPGGEERAGNGRGEAPKEGLGAEGEGRGGADPRGGARGGPAAGPPVALDRSAEAGPELTRQNTLFNLGKSKFYTLATEQHSAGSGSGEVAAAMVSEVKVTPAKVAAADDVVDASAHHTQLRLARSSFYDNCGPADVNGGGGELSSEAAVGGATGGHAPRAGPHAGGTGSVAHALFGIAHVHHAPVVHASMGHASIGPAPTGHASAGSAPAGRASAGHASAGPASTGPAPAGHASAGHAPSTHANVANASTANIPVGRATSDRALASHAHTANASLGHAPGGHAPGGAAASAALPLASTRCRGVDDCPFYGSATTDLLCSGCFRRRQTSNMAAAAKR